MSISPGGQSASGIGGAQRPIPISQRSSRSLKIKQGLKLLVIEIFTKQKVNLSIKENSIIKTHQVPPPIVLGRLIVLHLPQDPSEGVRTQEKSPNSGVIPL